MKSKWRRRATWFNLHAVPSTPRSIAICLILFCGIAQSLCAQTAPAPTAGSVFYLKERFAVKTKTGITGLEPGTGVRLVSENGNVLSVTNGATTFDVPKDKVTADVTEANLAAQNLHVTQQAGVQAFNAEVVRQQEERERAREEQAAAEQREQEMKKEQIAAQHQQQLLQAQQSLAEWQAYWHSEQRAREQEEIVVEHQQQEAAYAQQAAAAQAQRRQQASAEIDQLEMDWAYNPRSLINRSSPSSSYIDTANDPILQNRLDNLNAEIDAARSFQRSKDSVIIGR